MKKSFIYMIMSTLLFTGCMKHNLDDFQIINKGASKEEINKNVESKFGVTFDPNHDWCTTSTSNITISNIPSGTKKVQLLTYIADTDTTTSLLVLNEANVNEKSALSLSYDAPVDNLGLYVSLISNGSCITKKVISNVVSFSNRSAKRASTLGYDIPTTTPVIESTVESFASQRGWIPGQVLYDYTPQSIPAVDYSDEYKSVFRTIIFSHFKNGKEYNNLPLIQESGLYNENVYNLTTGGEPIILSPVYKSDKATKYGNEVWNSDLYYYYFKDGAMNGMSKEESVAFLNSLPKYKAIEFKQHFGENEDDVISKRDAYALVYWGDGTPEVGTTGTYQFPEGYKIGFMVRAKTTADGKKKQGELYGDGRLNNNINFFGNFKTLTLGTDGPRMGWITVNEKMLMCLESGTDRDFNDIIIEVEGGVKPIVYVPEFDNNYYTFCFEDRQLGDYDMNDIVIKAARINSTTVEYSIVACGANDLLKIMNVNGNIINDSKEIHEMFGVSNKTFINTKKGDTVFDPITERITVNEKFSFLDENTQPYIYNVSEGRIIKLSKKGEDPHGIMIPYDFKYPIEQTCIKDAYSEFNTWGQNRMTSTYWYKKSNEGFVY